MVRPAGCPVLRLVLAAGALRNITGREEISDGAIGTPAREADESGCFISSILLKIAWLDMLEISFGGQQSRNAT